MLDRNPAQRRFPTHLHADGILTGIRQGIARTDTANGANTTISTPDKGTGERLCLLQGHRASWIRYAFIRDFLSGVQRGRRRTVAIRTARFTPAPRSPYQQWDGADHRARLWPVSPRRGSRGVVRAGAAPGTVPRANAG